MADNNVKTYLLERIIDRLSLLKESFEFSNSVYLCSKSHGELSKADISSIISNYKLSVELNYLLGEYNKLFFDKSKLEVSREVNEIAGELELALAKDLLNATED